MAALPSIRPVLVRITGDDSLPDDDGAKHNIVCPFCGTTKKTAAVWYQPDKQTFNCLKCHVSGNSLSMKHMEPLTQVSKRQPEAVRSEHHAGQVKPQHGDRRLWGYKDTRCYIL